MGLWSPWYSSDLDGGDDDETLARVAEVYRYGCPPSLLKDVQCKVNSKVNATTSGGVFSNTFWHGGDVLRMPCNTSGLLCRAEDQPHRHQREGGRDGCHDYSIRFQCLFSSNKTFSPSDKDSLGSMTSAEGGYIALAAGLSIVLPLLCVILIQLRKSLKQPGPQAASAEPGAPTPSSVGDLPPTYEDIFGRDGHIDTLPPREMLEHDATDSAFHSREGSLDVLIQDGSPGGIGVPREGQGAMTRGITHEGANDRSPNSNVSPTLVTTATIDDSSYFFRGASNNFSSEVSVINIDDVHINNSSMYGEHSQAIGGEGRTQDAGQGQTLSDLSRSLPLLTSLTSHLRGTPSDPLSSLPNSCFQSSFGRRPGMNFSVFDLDKLEAPPPSYQEALVILAKTKTPNGSKN